MYTAFYGLREKPFALSPDPRFLYLAGSHREALAHLLYGIEQGEGFISVTGEVGTGKTTLCRTLLERLEGDTELAFLFNPSRTALELLQSICAEFDLPAEGLTRRTLMSQLNHFLLEQKRAGRRVLLIVDEAQTLSESTLEQVRLLSNLETSREKLIQILLLGQPELDRKLDTRALRQLRQRISVRWQLEPLGPQETRAYVRHRLAVAAGEPKDLFSESALREIHRRTGGVPRLVNQLCDRALLAGYAARAAQIGPRLVRAAAREIPDARRPRSSRSGGRFRFLTRPWPTALATVGLVGLSLYAGMRVGRDALSQGLQTAIFEAGLVARDDSRSPSADPLPAVGANAPSAGSASQTVLAWPLGAGPTARPLSTDLDASPAPVLNTSSALDAFAASPDAVSVFAPDGEALFASTASLAIPPKPMPPPIETAIAPGLLGRLVAARDAKAALAESYTQLLERYGRRVPSLAPAPIDPPSLARVLRSRGLAATSFDGGSLALLRRLDHPFAIPLSPYTRTERDARTARQRAAAEDLAHASASAPDASFDRTSDAGAEAGSGGTFDASASALANARWIAVLGFDDDRARVAGLVSGRTATVPVEELEAHWLESGMIVWERFERVPRVLRPEDAGDGVLWLQRALAELRIGDAPTSGHYDEATLAAVTRFQQERGLVADGVAGPLTQIALYARLGRYPVPRLSTSPSPGVSSSSAPSDSDRAGDRASDAPAPAAMPAETPAAMSGGPAGAPLGLSPGAQAAARATDLSDVVHVLAAGAPGDRG